LTQELCELVFKNNVLGEKPDFAIIASRLEELGYNDPKVGSSS
jgi:hypothetical protein